MNIHLYENAMYESAMHYIGLFDFGVGQSARHGVSLKNTHVIHLKSILLLMFNESSNVMCG